MTWILEIGTKKIGAGTKIRWYHHTTTDDYVFCSILPQHAPSLPHGFMDLLVLVLVRVSLKSKILFVSSTTY